MMKIQKPVMTCLLCAVLLGTLAGCGKTEEKTADIPEAVQTSVQKESVLSTETETKAESEQKEKSKKETAKSGESATETESETSGEKNSDTKTESAVVQNSETTASAVAAVSGTASTTAAETQAPQEEQTQVQETTPAEDNPPDVPAETVVVTEPPVAQIDAPDPDAPVETEPATEENTKTDELSLTVKYQGYDLTVGESVKNFVENIKPDTDPERAPSCLGNGEDLVYHYNDVTLYVWNDNDSYTLTGLDISASGITSVKGLDIGSAATFDGEKIYDMGNGCNIMVIASGGTVTAISYNKDL